MTQESKKGSSWWWALPAAAGLALVMTAVMLWPSASANPGVPVAQAADTATPTVTPTPNPNCVLNVTKDDNLTSRVPEGGQISYTITVENTADGTHCHDLTVTDTIPDDTDCVDTSIGSSDIDMRDATGCNDSGTVKWRDDSDYLSAGDSVEVTMVVELTSGANDGDKIDNEACATSTDDVGGDCDTERTTVGAPATSTPAPTATVAVPTVRPPAPVAPPVVAPAPPAPTALIAPVTGSGAESASGGSQPLALALGLAGGCLLLLSGAALLRRPR
jgi:fimbrial isopeptide formation D2 family protein